MGATLTCSSSVYLADHICIAGRGANPTHSRFFRRPFPRRSRNPQQGPPLRPREGQCNEAGAAAVWRRRCGVATFLSIPCLSGIYRDACHHFEVALSTLRLVYKEVPESPSFSGAWSSGVIKYRGKIPRFHPSHVHTIQLYLPIDTRSFQGWIMAKCCLPHNGK